MTNQPDSEFIIFTHYNIELDGFARDCRLIKHKL